MCGFICLNSFSQNLIVCVSILPVLLSTKFSIFATSPIDLYNLVVLLDNPNHIMSYSEMFMGNIKDDNVWVEYERDKLIETIN